MSFKCDRRHICMQASLNRYVMRLVPQRRRHSNELNHELPILEWVRFGVVASSGSQYGRMESLVLG
jgi:hypothetical protein